MAERRPRLGALPAGAFDLRPGSGGASWDFDKPEDRGRAICILGVERPYVVAGSPPCAGGCGLNMHANPPRVPGGGGRAEAEGRGALGIHGQYLPLAVGA
eukprot:11315343-Alexandrium_andersonii.AAC.1